MLTLKFYTLLKISALRILCLLLVLGISSPANGFDLSEEDRTLLKKIEKDSIQYFIKETNPTTGLTKDSSRAGAPASIAATGFALASFAIAANHGWISNQEASEKIKKTLATIKKKKCGKKGFYYHFLDPETGQRTWNSEVSSIDTALFIANALLAATYFEQSGLSKQIYSLYNQIDWPWMLNGKEFFCHGWKPQDGFLPYYWDMYAEHLILQALALGSSTNPVPASVWKAWRRESELYNGKKIIYSYTGSLFTYQYSHAFIDFRNLEDQNINYFSNSKLATIANWEFSSANQSQYKTYEGAWGLSASLGPDGYKPYGAMPGNAMHDGTIAVYAPISSIIFTPEESISVIKKIYKTQSPNLYGPYGFRDSYNLDSNWFANEYLGIDQGIIVLMLENFLNDGAIWKRFMKLPLTQRWIKLANLKRQENNSAE